MVSDTADPAQSQSLLASSTTQGFQEDDGLQAVHHHAGDGPQVHDPAREGLQSVDYDGRNGLQAVAPPPLEPETAYAHYGPGNSEKAAPDVLADDVTTPRRSGRRKWIWILVAALIAIAIAVGVGAGVGLSQKSSGSDNSNNGKETADEANSATSSSPSTSDPTASPTDSAPVTKGTTGLAALSCNNASFAISSEGIAYVQDCGVYYRANENMLAPDNTSWTRNLPLGANGKSMDPTTKYTFRDCIDHCDEYNSDRSTTDQPCYGVSYYANLTWAFKRWPGNCFLKNGRGKGTSTGDGTEDWAHTASAYKNCLDGGKGCAGDA